MQGLSVISNCTVATACATVSAVTLLRVWAASSTCADSAKSLYLKIRRPLLVIFALPSVFATQTGKCVGFLIVYSSPGELTAHGGCLQRATGK